MSFDITKCPVIDGYKRCKTRDGKDVKIIYESPTREVICEADGNYFIVTPKGIIITTGWRVTDADSLVNIPIKKTLWVNVYENGNGYVWSSKKNANDSRIASGRIARIKVEYEEGQFDE